MFSVSFKNIIYKLFILQYNFRFIWCVYVYIYIYKRVLVVSKSLCGYVSNQVQYNMENAQYLGLSYMIIIIY